jgi:hypothetical protein
MPWQDRTTLQSVAEYNRTSMKQHFAGSSSLCTTYYEYNRYSDTSRGRDAILDLLSGDYLSKSMLVAIGIQWSKQFDRSSRLFNTLVLSKGANDDSIRFIPTIRFDSFQRYERTIDAASNQSSIETLWQSALNWASVWLYIIATRSRQQYAVERFGRDAIVVPL